MTHDISEEMVQTRIDEAKRLIRENVLTAGQVKDLTLSVANAVNKQLPIGRRYSWINKVVCNIKET